MMLMLEVINLTHREMEFVKNNMDMLINTGFDIELFGKNSVKINGIPDLEYKAKTQNIFMDILDEMLTNERTSIKDVEERFIATVACKAAVKANMDLSRQEVDNLIQRLLKLKNPAENKPFSKKSFEFSQKTYVIFYNLCHFFTFCDIIKTVILQRRTFTCQMITAINSFLKN